jgi:hypothetical protein
VNKGLDVLELLSDVPVGPDDSPLMRIKVAKCGQTNAEVRNKLLRAFLQRSCLHWLLWQVGSKIDRLWVCACAQHWTGICQC